MRKFLLSAAVSLLLGTPVLAETVPDLPFGSDEPQSQIQWDNLVAKANQYRLSHQGAAAMVAAPEAAGSTAAVTGGSATDASPAPAPVAPRAGYFTGGKYKSWDDIRQDR